MGRLARRGVIVADLLRQYRAYAWVSFFTLLSNPMVRHDAKASVGQAFVKKEVLRLRDEAGLHFSRDQRHFGHPFVLAGGKPGAKNKRWFFLTQGGAKENAFWARQYTW